MKKLLLAVCILTVSAPSFAINHAYRDKLIRSGCTEMNAGQGCDINATKEQNGRRGFGSEHPWTTHPSTDYLTPPPAPKHHQHRGRYNNEDLMGMTKRDVLVKLTRDGFKLRAPYWENDEIKLLVGYNRRGEVNNVRVFPRF